MQSGVHIVDGFMALLFFGGLFSIVSAKKKKGRCIVRAWAEVVDFTIREEYDSDGQRDGTSYYPILQYTYGGYDQWGQYQNYVVRKSGI